MILMSPNENEHREVSEVWEIAARPVPPVLTSQLPVSRWPPRGAPYMQMLGASAGLLVSRAGRANWLRLSFDYWIHPRPNRQVSMAAGGFAIRLKRISSRPCSGTEEALRSGQVPLLLSLFNFFVRQPRIVNRSCIDAACY